MNESSSPKNRRRPVVLSLALAAAFIAAGTVAYVVADSSRGNDARAAVPMPTSVPLPPRIAENADVTAVPDADTGAVMDNAGLDPLASAEAATEGGYLFAVDPAEALIGDQGAVRVSN